MSKKIIAILAAVVCLICVFAGCGKKNAVLSGKDSSAAVTTTNGGFLAETNDYVYFINGSELYTEENTLGKVEKGALVRMAKADLEKEAGERTVETVVSKVVSSTDYSAGISVYGGKVYYATPNSEKNKVGEVLYDQLQFCSANLDGSEVKVIATATGTAGNATAYRFNQVGDTVYVTYVEATTNEEEETVNTIKVVKADGSEVFSTEYETYVFEKGATADYIYYTKAVENETLGQPESFNEVYSYKIGATAADKLLSGIGSNRNEKDANGNITFKFENKGVQGVKFSLVAAENNYLYLSVVNIDTSVSTDTYYAFVEEGTFENADTNEKVEGNYVKLLANVMNNGTSAAATLYVATSIYESPERIIYLDSTKGLCEYNYTKDNYDNLNGVSIIYHDETILTATLSYAQGDYVYYHVSGVYYQLNYKQADAEAVKLSTVTFSTAWYAPEVVEYNGKSYVLGTLSGAEYFDYVFAFEVESEEENEKLVTEKLATLFADEAWINAVEPDADDYDDIIDGLEETTYGEFVSGNGRSNALYVWKKAVALRGEEAVKEVNDYIETTYPNSASSKTSEEDEGCGSVAGAGFAIGGALLALAGYAVSKRSR